MNTIVNFCDNCGMDQEELNMTGGQTNTCPNCGHPVEPEETCVEDHDDPYVF